MCEECDAGAENLSDLIMEPPPTLSSKWPTSLEKMRVRHIKTLRAPFHLPRAWDEASKDDHFGW